MFCPNCGKEIPENIKFCNYCGTEQSVNFSSTTFQETSQQQPYDDHIFQQQSVMDSKTEAALRVGGVCLTALSVLSILLCFVWHQYEHFVNYVGIGDVIILLVQSCMIVGGISMICMSKSKAVLQIGGSVLLALSALSVLICFWRNHYGYLITSRNSIVTGEFAATGWFELILIQSSMIVVGILMIYISKGKGR